ncbi:hypothetical protein CFAM422_009245 [Trichoderma lentiforme]|uniref:Uncharacterized protein n=1 Tax=Trichoderma lentiforme TaxID=1567552 RepID=A0A9P4XA84_9HYPO|nr:hypothetical protein CFAM422_009245 [Trichoderma lentiforme]
MDGPNAWPDIYSAALDCDLLFDECLTQIPEPSTIGLLNESAATFGRLARDHQARFQAWASYLGVFAEEDVCLDRRLSKSKDVQIMIIQISDDSTRSIAPIRETELHIQQSAPSIDNIAGDLRQTQESVEGSIDRLHRLGVIIRQSSTASLISRVRAFSEKRSDSSLEEMSFLMIKFLYPMASLNLQRLLSRSILERHFNIQYRGEHQQRLAARRMPHKKVDNGSQEVLRPITRKDYVDEAADVVHDKSEKGTDTMLSKSGTKPSTLQTQEFQRKLNQEKPLKALSVVSKTSSVPIGDINYPRPPKSHGEHGWTKCDWCFESYPHDKFQDAKWWRYFFKYICARRHVDHDLRPYVCLVNTCSESLDAFDRFTPWIEHMEKHHSPNWIGTINCRAMWRCDIEHESPILFEDEASLKGHIREHHEETFTDSQIERIARRSSIRIPGSKDVCPLCGFDSSGALLDADKSNHPQHSSRIKRKRRTQTKVNTSVQAKRKKVHFHDEGGRRDRGSTSSSESESELASGTGTESVPSQLKDQLRRKHLSRHIATHLKALSFMSLSLKNFQGQLETEDQDLASEDRLGDENENDEPSGLDTELDAMSLNFEDTPAILDSEIPAMFTSPHETLSRLEDGPVSPTFDGSEFHHNILNQPADAPADAPATPIFTRPEFLHDILHRPEDPPDSPTSTRSSFLDDILRLTEKFIPRSPIETDFIALVNALVLEYRQGGFIPGGTSERISCPWVYSVTREDIEECRGFLVSRSADAISNVATLGGRIM